jgi:hypothetical protein
MAEKYESSSRSPEKIRKRNEEIIKMIKEYLVVKG